MIYVCLVSKRLVDLELIKFFELGSVASCDVSKYHLIRIYAFLMIPLVYVTTKLLSSQSTFS